MHKAVSRSIIDDRLYYMIVHNCSIIIRFLMTHKVIWLNYLLRIKKVLGKIIIIL